MESEGIEDLHKVILATKVPLDYTSFDLETTFSPFGKVIDTLLLKNKQQAFVEFELPSNGAECLRFYKGPMIIYASNKSCIVHKEKSIPNKILHITFDNVKYPLIADLLSTSFMIYGEVRKVLIFNFKDKENALIEMDSIESAIKIKEVMNGKSLFSDGNKMTIVYSKKTELEVREQNEKCRDYN